MCGMMPTNVNTARWKGGGIGKIGEGAKGKLLLAITKEIYRYYTAWLHNNTNTHTKGDWKKGKAKQKQRGSKTICILSGVYMGACKQPLFRCYYCFIFLPVLRFFCLPDVCGPVWKPILNLLPLLSSYGAYFLALQRGNSRPCDRVSLCII